MNQINPYRRNCEIIRKFFAKPIFLIAGIVLLLYAISSLTLSFLLKRPLGFVLLSIVLCITVSLFYFKARSKNHFISFKAPTILMYMISVIGIVFSSLSALFFGFCYDLSAFTIFIITSSIISLLYFISMLRLAFSLRKSLSTVYLQRKGAVIFGVTSIILAVISIIYYSSLITVRLSGIEAAALIQGVFVTVACVICAILGFMYNSYIKKISTSLETGGVGHSDTDIPEPLYEDNPTLDMWSEPITYEKANNQAPITQPVEFTPQSVFDSDNNFANETKKSENYVNEIDLQNPYLSSPAPTSKRCTNCGKENPNINIFCGNCGNRL